jgi:hypothetical protein
MSWNNVIPASVINKMLDDILKQPKQLHFDEDVFYTCFYIKEEYLTSCNEAFTYVKATGGGSYGTIAKDVDHPAFAALRKHLSDNGYIQIPDYPCWNGDRVIKSFYLNDVFFREGEKFVCGSAMSGHLKFRKMYGKE